MPLEGCAFVCGIMAACSGILSWYSMYSGDAEIMIPAFAFALVEVSINAYVLVVKYCH